MENYAKEFLELANLLDCKDKRITALEYQQEAMKTARIENNGTWLPEAIFGLSGEVGECSDIVKKHLYQGHNLDINHLKEELSDVLWYLQLACSAIDISLVDLMEINLDKINKRYPNGFDPNRSINRKE